MVIEQRVTEQQVTEQSQEQIVYARPESLSAVSTHYCPGCTHGLIHKLIAEVIDELDLREQTIAVAPVGCAVFLNDYFEVDGVEAAHGRAPAMATGLKRVQPDKLVFTYQGDGDLAAIGIAEILWAATRGEDITVFFINNAVYGMTGGQMAPTTLPGQITSSSPSGRDSSQTGMPIRIAELLAGLPGTAYVVRRAVYNIYAIKQAKKAIRTALKVQVNKMGFSMVEFLSSCPVNWHLTPCEALDWIKTDMVVHFPLDDYKVADQVRALH